MTSMPKCANLIDVLSHAKYVRSSAATRAISNISWPRLSSKKCREVLTNHSGLCIHGAARLEQHVAATNFVASFSVFLVDAGLIPATASQ